ncbi:MAG: hypothetical protein ACYTGH_21835, partial [Planctomycetota bacterium]
ADPRLKAFREGIALVAGSDTDRARRLLEYLSDRTEAPLESAECLPKVSGIAAGAGAGEGA